MKATKGDQPEVSNAMGLAVLETVRSVGNRFRKQIGILAPAGNGKTAVEQVREVRGRDEWDRENLA